MTDLVDMERARMKVTRVCIYHVDHDAAGKSHAITGEIFAHILCECICARLPLLVETPTGYPTRRRTSS